MPDMFDSEIHFSNALSISYENNKVKLYIAIVALVHFSASG